MPTQIFKGIRILDFTQVIAGSYGTTVMGDMGAEVIKVEPPVSGDTLRLAGPMVRGESGFFLLNNRNKKSISVDLKSPDGVELVKAMIPHCDVVTQNFKPGIMEKLGLGYDAVRAIREDIIYASVSGYGFNNRYSSRAAYDNIIQCETGLSSQNGMPDDGRPLRSPFSVSDYVGAIYSAFAIAAALFHRDRTGQGQNIDIAMYDAMMSIMDNDFLMCDLLKDEIATGDRVENLKRLGLKSCGNRHPGAAPHGFYRTKDGSVAHMSLTNEMWHRLLRIIEREDLIGDRRYDQLDDRKARWREIDGMIEQWSSTKTTEEAMAILEENRLPCGRVRTVDQAYADPHNAERGIFSEVEHSVAGRMRITNIPIKFSETPAQIQRSSPLLGEHNADVLTGLLGYSTEKIASLVERGVLTAHPPSDAARRGPSSGA